MSIEQALAENTAALIANTASNTALNETMVKHNEILSNVKAGAAAKADTATTGTKADTAKTTGTKAGGKASTAKVDTKSFVAEASAWLNEHKQGTPEFDERAGALKKIAQNFGVERLSGVPDANAAEATAFLQQLKAGEDPFPAAEEADNGVL